MGKRTKLIEEVYGDTPVTTTSVWQYDDLNRLISETVNGQTTTHEYDAVSNRIKQNKNGQITTYSYDDNDRLTQETGARTASYTYDKQGNTLTQNVNGTVTNYVYNTRNELVQANDVTFGYDIDGIRNSKSKNGTTLTYITDKNRDYAQVILEKQNNTPVASYSYGDDLISQHVNGATSYFIYDGLGSTKALTDSNGLITDTYQYNAYGEITAKTGNTDNIYLYTGEQYDRSLNQYYLRARYYNQGVGRFTQMDSWQGKASNPTTLNKYLYADANPVMNIDPSGYMTLAGVMSSININSQLNAMNTASRINTVRRTAARLCKICGTLAKQANEAGELLEKFKYTEVLKATRGTKYQAHHVFQDARMTELAVKFQTGYTKGAGLAIPLFGNTFGGGARKGSPHYFANQAQKGSKGKFPTHVAYNALTAAGCRKRDATEIVQMFETAYEFEGWL